MKTLCRVTALALTISALLFLISGFDALAVRAHEVEGLIGGPITVFTVLGWEFGEYASPLFAALAHGLLAVVVLCLPDRLNAHREADLPLGIQGDPLE